MAPNQSNTNNRHDREPDRHTAQNPGQRLKEIRLSLEMTQEALAGRLGFSRSVVANAERNREISRNYLKVFAETFEAKADELASIEPTSSRPRGGAADVTDAETDDVFFRRASTTTNLDGTWYALWETSVEGEEALNREELQFKMRRGTLRIENKEASPDNPEGGYRWIGQCRIYDNQYIIGTYLPREPNVRSKGCLYLVLHSSGRFMNGQWIGCGYDSDWSRGLVVIARDTKNLKRLLKRHRKSLPKVVYQPDNGEEKSDD